MKLTTGIYKNKIMPENILGVSQKNISDVIDNSKKRQLSNFAKDFTYSRWIMRKSNREKRKDYKSLRFWQEKEFRVNKKKGDFKKFKKRQKRVRFTFD